MATSLFFYDAHFDDASQVAAIVGSGGAVGQAPAVLSGILPLKAGSATAERQGTYTALVEKTYRIEIHVGGTGAFGSAQWRWSDTGGDTWNAQNLTTQNGTWVNLSHGVQWRFVAGGTNPQFVVGDAWLMRAVLKYGPAKVIDGSRDSEWRSGTAPVSSVIEWQIDLGLAAAPQVMAILDHNFPSNLTTQWLGKSSGFTDPPDFTHTMTWNASRMLSQISSNALRFWRLRLTMGASPRDFLRFSEVYLGPKDAFVETFDIGYRDGERRLEAVDLDGTLRRGPAPLPLTGRTLQLTYGHAARATDYARLKRVWDWSHDRTFNVLRPFYFVPIDSDPTDFSLWHWANDFDPQHLFLDRWSVPPEFAEVIRTAAP